VGQLAELDQPKEKTAKRNKGSGGYRRIARKRNPLSECEGAVQTCRYFTNKFVNLSTQYGAQRLPNAGICFASVQLNAGVGRRRRVLSTLTNETVTRLPNGQLKVCQSLRACELGR